MNAVATASRNHSDASILSLSRTGSRLAVTTHDGDTYIGIVRCTFDRGHVSRLWIGRTGKPEIGEPACVSVEDVATVEVVQ